MNGKILIIVIGACLCAALQSKSQVVFDHIDNTVYPFLEEMAAAGIIRINTFSKPFARNFIAAKLDSISNHRESLNQRQAYQLDFFLKDYGKELRLGKDWDRRLDALYVSDSTLNLTINPILGGSVMINENGSRIHRRVGAGFFASFENFSAWGSLRDNAVSDVLALPGHLTPRDGQNYKSIAADNRSDYNEAFGGVSYQWKWGDISVMKDRLEWGNTEHHANIFSGKAPSYAMINFRMYPLKWLDFQYIHGWLVSEELDSARTYLTPIGNRRVDMNKNIAANYFTVKSNWNIDFTFGNSIVYSDNGIQPVYFIPFMFFKSADHTYSGTGSNELGQNAQLFFDISARAIKNVHLYTSLFIDEVSIGNFWDSDKQTNILSLKLGATWFNALPNLHLTAEYTYNRPWTYRHQINSTTFESNQYNLGHYMGENADEVFVMARFKPLRNLCFRGSGWYARKGPEHVYEIVNGNANVTGLTFMEETVWEQYGASLYAEWEIINDAVLFTGVTYQSSSGEAAYTSEYLSGKVITGEFGFRVGW